MRQPVLALAFRLALTVIPATALAVWDIVMLVCEVAAQARLLNQESARQVNLVAFHPTIAAARAGDAGRGFTVMLYA